MKTSRRPPRKAAAKSPPRKAPARKPAAPRKPASGLPRHVKLARAALGDKKGVEIVVLNMAGVSDVTDYMILASGLNNPHLRALANEVVKQLRQADPPVAPHRRAGSAESEWLVLDYLDFIVHLFTPRMRAYYALERLWKDAPVFR